VQYISLSGTVLNEFVKDVVIGYVEDDMPEVRKAAAVASCQIFIKDNIIYQTSNHAMQVVSQVLEKLLTVGITDPGISAEMFTNIDPNIRLLVLSALDEKFDRHLAQARNIRILFIALNDEVFQIREVAISIIGRLTVHNPGHVMPSLRKTMIRLLTELEYSTVNRNKEEAARLLGLVIGNAKTLVKPYVEAILKVVMPKAHDPNAGVASSILGCIGELAKVGGEDLRPYVKKLMPLILETLQDQSSSVKRDTSLRTLGELASNSGYVIQPYLDFPALFDLFIGILKSEPTPATRRETVKVMGILGALDPYKHQTAEKGDTLGGSTDQKDGSSDVTMLMMGLGNTEEYYPTVVMSALMQILRDPSLNTHHIAVVQSIMSMYKALGLKCVSFLPEVCIRKDRLTIGHSCLSICDEKLPAYDPRILFPTTRYSR
jgi:serine/threonine-protein kinase mTOR